MSKNKIISIKTDEGSIEIKEGRVIGCKGDKYVITEIISFGEILCVDINNGKVKRLQIVDIEPEPQNHVQKNIEVIEDLDKLLKEQWGVLGEYSKEQLDEIEKRYTAIKPMLLDNMSRQEIEEYSKKINIHYTTLYRWFKRYKTTGTLLGLLSKSSGRKKGETRLDLSTEEIMQHEIKTYLLAEQKPSVQSVIDKIITECNKLGVKPPSKNTVRNRISKQHYYNVAQ